jgi:hypothetical protein
LHYDFIVISSDVLLVKNLKKLINQLVIFLHDAELGFFVALKLFADNALAALNVMSRYI